MAQKGLLILAVTLVALVLISSEVVARELAEKQQPETTQEAKVSQTNSVEDAKYGGRGGYGGQPGGGGGYGGQPGGGGGYCRHRCCSYGRCRCCSSPTETYDAVTVGIPHN